ncbi:MAG: Cna B-type domain-containing protein [[Clostridium] aminophilum]|uniref:Cna B-type domain-containing protein n=1 Tax=[Clostridium] aminophilum TaxID=1526 RepID=UPI0026EA9A8E|nr:Cna B-type domain-containing protein [[Clostridium] aminophilum]MDD6196077.1 Cna B-type domain-containing protein [[Clostridium] aminophilum]
MERGLYEATKRHVSGDVYRADGAAAQTDTVLTLNNEFRLATVTLSGKKLTDQAGTELTAEQIAFADRFRGIPEELTFRIAYTTDDLSDDSKKASAVRKVLTEDTASGAGYPVERKMTLSRTDWKYYGDGADRTKTSLTMTGLPRFIPVGGKYREAHYRFFEYAMSYPDGAGGVAAPILCSGVNADGTVDGLLAETAIGSVTSGFGEESSFASAEDNGFYSDSITDSATCVNRIPMRSLEICKEWDDQFDRDGVRPQKMTFRIAQGDDTAENSSVYKDVQLTGDNASTKAAGDENANIWRSTKTENGDLPAYSLPVYREGTSEAASYQIREDVSGDGASSYTRHQVKRNEGAYTADTDQTEIALPAYTAEEQSASAGEVKGDTVWFKNGRDADTIALSIRKLWRFAGKDYDGTENAVPAALKKDFEGNSLKMIFSLQYREAGTDVWKNVVQDEDGTKKTGFTQDNALSVSPAVSDSGALNTADPKGLQWIRVPVHADDHDLAGTPAFEFRLRESVKLGADAFTPKEVFSDPVSAAEGRKEQEKAEDDAEYKPTVTNEFKSASLSVKKTWDDQENRYGTRTEKLKITVIPKIGADADGNGGEEIAVDGLNAKKDGVRDVGFESASLWAGIFGAEGAKAGTIANTLITGNLSVTKVWDDDRDRDGIRPDTVTLHLVREAGGQSEQLPEAFDRKQENQKARGEGDWTTAVWENLPVRDADGTEFRYTVTEEADEMPGYVPYQKLDVLFDGEIKAPAAFALSADGDTKLTVTNRHLPAETKVEIRKEWIEYRAVEDRMTLVNGLEVKLRNYEEGDFVGSYHAVGTDGSERKEGSALGVRRYRPDWKNTSHAVKIAVSKKWTDEAGKAEIGTDSLDVTNSAQAENTAVDLEELTQTVMLSKENDWSAVVENLPDETVEGYPVTFTIGEAGRNNYRAAYEASEPAQMQSGMPHSGDDRQMKREAAMAALVIFGLAGWTIYRKRFERKD